MESRPILQESELSEHERKVVDKIDADTPADDLFRLLYDKSVDETSIEQYWRMADVQRSVQVWKMVGSLDLADAAELGNDDGNLAPQEYDWVVPDLLEAGDRFVLTGAPGVGKMTHLRQFCVQVASGIHPVTLESIPPKNTLLVDVQESEDQAHRELLWPRNVAGDRLEPGRFHFLLEHQLARLDDPFDHLLELIDLLHPSLVALGPLQRVARLFGVKADLTNDSRGVEKLQAKLDQLRGDADRAILIEAHPGHGPRKGVIGPSLWNNWPEFGYELARSGAFFPWRMPRDQVHPRAWPKRWRRNDERTPGEWLFTAANATGDEQWTIIEREVRDSGVTTIRGIAERTNLSRSAAHRLLQKYAVEWENLLDELGLDGE